MPYPYGISVLKFHYKAQMIFQNSSFSNRQFNQITHVQKDKTENPKKTYKNYCKHKIYQRHLKNKKQKRC